MDNETPPALSQTPEELTAQVAGFFERIGASDVCPVCSNTTWEVMAVGDYQPGLLMAKEPAPAAGMSYVPLIAANCERCGFLRTHLRSKVLGR